MDDPEPTSLLLTISYQFSSELYIISGILFLLLILASITSGCEAAILSLDAKNLDGKLKDHYAEVTAISKIKQNSKKFISTIIVFRTLINLGIILIFAKICESFSNYFQYPIQITLIFYLCITSFLIVIIGKIIPQAYARRNAFLVSCRTIKFIHFITQLCLPVTHLFSTIITHTDKYTKKRRHIDISNLTQALEIASEDKNTSDAEHKILESIVNFGNIETRQVMTPRMDIFALQKDTPFTTLLELVSKNGYSRIPVYGKDIDNIIGILYSKDLIQYLDHEQLNWNNLLKNPYFIPENKKIDNLLADFKNRKMHLAIVVDEYGETSGIVSLEDVIEEIVGEINDEFDEDNISYSKIDDTIYVFEGKTSIIDFCRIMDINENEFEDVRGEADTLAGLILELAEEFPKKLEKIYYKNFIFQVESLDRNRKRLKQIKITHKTYNEEKLDNK